MKKNRLKVTSEQPANSLAQVLRNNIEEIGFGIFCAVAVAAVMVLPTENKDIDNTKDAPTTSYSQTDEYTTETTTKFAPVGYHYEDDVLVKNPEGLVRANHPPKARYHLEEFEYDDSLFYVVEDGYHMEDGRKVKDGYHIENGEVVKDGYHIENGVVVKDVTLSLAPSTKKED